MPAATPNSTTTTSSSSESSSSATSSSTTLPTRTRNHSRSGSAEKKFVGLGQTLSTQGTSQSAPETAPEADTTASESEAEKVKPVEKKKEEVSVAQVESKAEEGKKSSTEAPLVSGMTASASAPSIDSVSSTRTKSTSTKPENGLTIEVRPRAVTAIGVETAEIEAKVRQIQAAQANRRPKMTRLTPTHPSASASAIGLSRQAVKKRTEDAFNGTGSQSSTPTPTSNSFEQGVEATHNSLSFPSKSPVSGLPPSSSVTSPPLHPGSRKALALRAAGGTTPPATGHEPHAGLQLDLQCLPSPSIHNGGAPASTSKLPDMVRKKSGEPVKSSLKQVPTSASFFVNRADSSPSMPTRSLQNYKSAPSTPLYPTTPGASKNVHFDTHLEHVKLFKHKQRPAAVSRDGSPEQTETETEEEKDAYKFPYLYGKKAGSSPPASGPFKDGNSPVLATPGSPVDAEEQLVLRLPNFPSSTKLRVDRAVFLERVYLADDLRSVRGTVRVRNLAFEKWVAVRFTLDGWKTVSEVSADWSESLSSRAKSWSWNSSDGSQTSVFLLFVRLETIQLSSEVFHGESTLDVSTG